MIKTDFSKVERLLLIYPAGIVNGLADDFKLDTTPPVLVIPHGKNHGSSSTKGGFFSSKQTNNIFLNYFLLRIDKAGDWVVPMENIFHVDGPGYSSL